MGFSATEAVAVSVWHYLLYLAVVTCPQRVLVGKLENQKPVQEQKVQRLSQGRAMAGQYTYFLSFSNACGGYASAI